MPTELEAAGASVKRSRPEADMAVSDQMPSSWLQQIREAMREEIKEPLERLERVQTQQGNQIAALETSVKADTDSLNKRLVEIETNDRHGGSDASTALASAGSCWTPSFVEIRGFCSFDERRTKGISRGEALQLREKLIGHLHDTLKSSVGDLSLRGQRSFGLRINVAKGHLNEVFAVWKDVIDSKDLNTDDWQLYIKTEPHPDRVLTNRVMGKLKSFFLEQECMQGKVLEFYWAPEFCVTMKQNNDECILAQIEDLSVVWTDDFRRIAQKDEQALDKGFKLYRRK
eukprot:TRINITY_DN23998_c0_g1_i1.p1 TRINITY_DN23998_c0_g1~~TRINITY_DN23998_c0_g1_i1.p1  ORF type:complete len:286 (+),score=63.44 TRINITY_DN23998_c0_g1_i1:152-1009(+)